MQLHFHQVDAFSDRPFAGNPAMVYRLDQWLEDGLMQQVAAEHNLAETAFVVAEDDGYRIRWFTPSTEVPLCGHATLASAHVLFDVYAEQAPRLDFKSRSGLLSVSRENGRLWLDFPRIDPQPLTEPVAVAEALGCEVREVYQTRELFVVLDSEQAVRDCAPDMAALARLPGLGVIVTAPGERHDFVSRYFAPGIGIPEDPVTGSTHCSLIPYWAARLGKSELQAFQCSTRGGELFCRLEGERVKIGGMARRVASGTLML
ncbi:MULTISPECIES: PhzF family phenazine biosynthesis protein [Pseudomonas]|uniref:PhzF family phenazine biosynthesis protein n=1 Tax=Pseudomonas mosselii TaxID=78327 RepID=A0ABX9B9T3_9PSED|nr:MULTISPECIES: PhzF family phenazine biosynthesis protein [Pseudomonas]KXG80179.1 isomerase [Pseudomonas mosselii]MBC3454781.1 PhzF family phenazine biosynthesis protein [Pseudomonas mosselii]MBH3308474.1 PhzF family phenazine biosynthesis protein [Pseudomonas mosselii]MBH3325374.1 PhzF family phenazine biosynthesis protein [Pseudomonas mosselii]MBS9762461.1 PhzF family phenazine biosynthesis protein [Pseudomonas mosselii]